MKPVLRPSILIAFGALGCVFLGLVAGLGNVVTAEYVNHSLPGNPIVQEYDFRIGGKYGLVSMFLLLGGAILAIGGNIMGFHMLYEYSSVEHRPYDGKWLVSEKTYSTLFVVCPQCKKKLPTYSKFCPKCGTDLILKTHMK